MSSDVRTDLLTRAELILKFDVSNYLVFALMLAVSAGIGVWFWLKGRGTSEEFLLADRSMGTLPLAMSLVASFMSAITLLGTPAEIYVSGSQFVIICLAMPLVMAATAHLYLPVYQQLHLATAYQYLSLR